MANRSGVVLSGMRATGSLHLGHYLGVIRNWVRLQHEYDCYFFVADWHALTTHYEDTAVISEVVWDMVVDWLAAGVNPKLCKIFIQSHVPEHAELHLLLSMTTPVSWLERVPTYKDQQEKLKGRDLATYGFLGYPVLQSADILVYRANYVPVGADQVPHVELTREIARRFNEFFGREPGMAAKAEAAIKKMGKKNARMYNELRKRFQEEGDGEALGVAQALIENQSNISLADRERLTGYLQGTGRTILPEPEVLLTATPKVPGVDGQKMSKSYGNTIDLRDDAETVERKLRTMMTDPARVRRSDPGDPNKCPVFELHKIYSDEDTLKWVVNGCTTAGIGCLDCKQPLIDSIQAELEPIRRRTVELEADPGLVRRVIAEGTEAARDTARETMEEVRRAMGLYYG
ncbi:MAG: tryptophan--tRNA ligase [Gammaproteobacteria bacterium]|nr:MAG: tryptophan--tRNA ligase [Gammaproteobacteria bacterium]